MNKCFYSNEEELGILFNTAYSEFQKNIYKM